MNKLYRITGTTPMVESTTWDKKSLFAKLKPIFGNDAEGYVELLTDPDILGDSDPNTVISEFIATISKFSTSALTLVYQPEADVDMFKSYDVSVSDFKTSSSKTICDGIVTIYIKDAEGIDIIGIGWETGEGGMTPDYYVKSKELAKFKSMLQGDEE